MNDNDIIRMALEHFGAVLKPSDLEVKLAVLTVAAEREACAKVCEAYKFAPAAEAIRARGDT